MQYCLIPVRNQCETIPGTCPLICKLYLCKSWSVSVPDPNVGEALVHTAPLNTADKLKLIQQHQQGAPPLRSFEALHEKEYVKFSVRLTVIKLTKVVYTIKKTHPSVTLSLDTSTIRHLARSVMPCFIIGTVMIVTVHYKI